MSAPADLAAVRDLLDDQLGPRGIDYGALGDASRLLRHLSVAEEARAARATGDPVEDILCLLQSLRALRALLDGLIDGNRATWDSVALLGTIVEMLTVELDDDADIEPALPAAPADVAARAAAAILDTAASHRRRAEFYGDRVDARAAEFLEAVAARISATAPPDNVVALPARRRPRPVPGDGGAA